MLQQRKKNRMHGVLLGLQFGDPSRTFYERKSEALKKVLIKSLYWYMACLISLKGLCQGKGKALNLLWNNFATIFRNGTTWWKGFSLIWLVLVHSNKSMLQLSYVFMSLRPFRNRHRCCFGSNPCEKPSSVNPKTSEKQSGVTGWTQHKHNLCVSHLLFFLMTSRHSFQTCTTIRPIRT